MQILASTAHYSVTHFFITKNKSLKLINDFFKTPHLKKTLSLSLSNIHPSTRHFLSLKTWPLHSSTTGANTPATVPRRITSPVHQTSALRVNQPPHLSDGIQLLLPLCRLPDCSQLASRRRMLTIPRVSLWILRSSNLLLVLVVVLIRNSFWNLD